MKCPDCGREMKVITARKPEDAWLCEYCDAEWKKRIVREWMPA